MGELLANIAWALCHSTLNAMPKLVFNRNILWSQVCRGLINHPPAQNKQIQKDNEREHSKRREYTYKVGSKVLIKEITFIFKKKTQLLNANNKRGTLTSPISSRGWPWHTYIRSDHSMNGSLTKQVWVIWWNQYTLWGWKEKTIQLH